MSKNKFLFLAFLLGVICLTFSSCDKDDTGDSPSSPSKYHWNISVTVIASINGLGDNGYVDEAMGGIFEFAEKNSIPLNVVQPETMQEAEELFQDWMDSYAAEDSNLLVLGSSAYEELALKASFPEKKGKGTQILLFESDNENLPEGVYGVNINRYGISYLAGAMCGDRDARIVAAEPNEPILKSAIQGFQDGFQAHARKGKQVVVDYLAQDESGFAMPDSAYRYADRIYKEEWLEEYVYPLVGSSLSGIFKYADEDILFIPWIIGMDVNMAGLQRNIPFSVVIRMGDVLNQRLTEWFEGKKWPKTETFGMKDKMADIELTPTFEDDIYIGTPPNYKDLYRTYYQEALGKEAGYEK